MKKILSLFLCCLMVLTLTGCGGSSGDDITTYTYSSELDIKNLDSSDADDGCSLKAIHAVIDGLTKTDKKGNIVNAVAKSEELSEDGLTHTYKLRKDVKWTNGDPVTAHDFVYAWQRIFRKKGSYYYMFADGIASIEGAQELSDKIDAGEELTDDDLQKISDDFVKIVGKIDDVEGVGAMNGSGTMIGMSSSGSSNSMSVYIVLKEDMKHSNKEIAKMIKDDTSSLNCDISVNESTMDMGSMVGSGINIQIKGDNLDKLQDISKDMVDILKNTDGAIDIKSSLDNSEVEQRVSVNKDEAMKYGLTVAQVYQQISEKLKSETTSTTITSNSNDLAVVIKNNTSETTIKDLKLLEIKGTKNNKDAKVKLNKIATITNATTPASINHKNQTRYMTVSASVDEDHNIGLISRDIQSKIDDYNTPNGYEVELTGENETINSTMKDLVLMILLAIVFIYLIMVAQFQSLLSPFIVMFTIPLAFTGGLLGLLVTRQILSVTSMLGFLILAGIVVNNGIVFVDYVNQLRLDGVDKRTALLETGRARIRPILMTAMTTILAMSTMALGVGMGSELSQGLSIVTIGGLLYATLLTLFIVPILYDIFHRREMKKIIIDDED